MQYFEQLLAFVTRGVRMDQLSRKTLYSYKRACDQMTSLEFIETKRYPGSGRGMTRKAILLNVFVVL